MRLPLRALATTALASALAAGAAAAPAGVAVASTAPSPGVSAAPTADAAPKAAQVLVNAAPGTSSVPDLGTKSWVLADLDTGQILAMRDPDRVVRPASTLKLLTALTIAPRLAPDQPYRAVKADEKAEGNRVVMHAGMKYTVADLLHAALLPSANDAAVALARANGGLDGTLAQMNAEAARLGATHTVATNPSGLDEDGQQTTAYDMALIGRAAFGNPEIAGYLALKKVDFPGESEDGKRITYLLWNHNQMLQHDYAGALGGKSGYTSKAGRTFVGAASRDGHRYLVSLMGIRGNTYRTPERLLTWAFANAGRLQPVGQLAEPSAPAPTFDRTIQALPAKGQSPTTASKVERAADAPTSTEGVSTWGFPGLPHLPLPGMPPPLTLLTWLMLGIVVLRVRVYWIAHRHRTAWVELEVWARRQARSARRHGPADPTVGPVARELAAETAAATHEAQGARRDVPARSL